MRETRNRFSSLIQRKTQLDDEGVCITDRRRRRDRRRRGGNREVEGGRRGDGQAAGVHDHAAAAFRPLVLRASRGTVDASPQAKQ